MLLYSLIKHNVICFIKESGGFPMSTIFNYSSLEKRIHRMYGNFGAFSKLIGMTERKFNSKVNNETEFSLSEIEKAADLLKLSPEEIPAYFFEVKHTGFDC